MATKEKRRKGKVINIMADGTVLEDITQYKIKFENLPAVTQRIVIDFLTTKNVAR